MNAHKKIQEIAYSIIYESIDDYLTRKAMSGVSTVQVLDYIFPAERRIRSIIGGLETSMGTQTWERLAEELAVIGGFTVLDAATFNSTLMPRPVPSQISGLINSLNQQRLFEPQDFHAEVQRLAGKIQLHANDFTSITKGKGIDLALMKGKNLFLFDIKTNQINAGDGNKLFLTLREWIAYSALRYRGLSIYAYLVFPFDPHSGDFWKKESGKILPLQQGKSALCEGEFWDLISGQSNTWSDLLSAFKQVGTSDIRKKHENLFQI